MNWAYELWGSVLFALAFLTVLQFANSRRDARFVALASEYGLKFEKHSLPRFFESGVKYPIRSVRGLLAGNQIIIEDSMQSYLSGPYIGGMTSMTLPTPLVGVVGIVVRTEVVVNGRRQQVYPDVNFVTPIKRIKSFLDNVADQYLLTKSKPV